ncbi:MAG: peptidyl-prolyl cis-trans isomerase [Acidobacteria bacterium]|nr:peptidyl-prolyl cis-trans isomerase [Acidobacteriota bacterium]
MKANRVYRYFSFVFLLVFLLQNTQVVEEIIAKVNDQIITRRAYEKKLLPLERQLYLRYSGEELVKRLKQLRKQVLNQMIEQALISYQARIKGITATEEEVLAVIERIKKENKINSDEELDRQLKLEGTSLAELKEVIKNNIIQRKLVEQEVSTKIVVTNLDVRRYYNEHKKEFTTDEEVRISQIFIPRNKRSDEELLAKAKTIREKIKNYQDFVLVASELSGEASPDLGYFKRGELAKELERVAFSLKVGEISKPIITEKGAFIIAVTDRKEAQVRPLSEVKAEIQRRIWQEKAREGLREYIDRLKKSSYIAILHDPTKEE